MTYGLGSEGTHGYQAKVAADVVYLPSGFPVSDAGQGVRTTDKASLAFRVQRTLRTLRR